MLSGWLDLALAAVAAGACAYALVLRRRERRLLARLASRERGGHFLGESPDVRQILRHAFAAAAEILPISRFTLYRVGEDGRVEEVWTMEPRPEEAEPELRRDAESPHLGQWVDSVRLMDLSATETERSFAPRDLLAGGPNTLRLRLPLYSGDRLIAHLVLESPEPIDDSRKAEIRALLGPLPSSLHDGRIEPTGLPHFFPMGSNDGIIGAQFWPTDGYSTNFCTVIYRTHDGGLNWQPTTPVKYMGVLDFITARKGWIWSPRPHSTGSTVPVKGILYSTDDGGASWRPVRAEKSMEDYLTHGEDIVRLDFVDDEYGWAIARDGHNLTQLLKTTDSGVTWTKLPLKIAP